MRYAINVAADGRILSVTFSKYASGDAVIVGTIPEGDVTDYRYVNGVYLYDPLPDSAPEEETEPAPQSLEARVAAVESDVASLTAAIEKGLSL